MPTDGQLQLYPMLRVTIMLILGIVVGRAVYPDVSSLCFLIAAAVAVAVAIALRRWAVTQSVLIGVAFFFFGAFLITRSSDRMNVPLPKSKITYSAILSSEPVVHGKVIQTDLIIVGNGSPLKVRASILRDTVNNRWQRLHVGDGIVASSLLEEPKNFAKSTFDYAGWLREHGFAAETFVFYSDWKKSRVSMKDLSLFERTAIAARSFRQRLLAEFHDYGADGRVYAVLAAMTLGDKSALPKELKDDYSIAGASHVLALSGLHLGIIYAVLSLLTIGFRRRWIPQLVIMLAVWSYVVLVGMSASVVRSAFMLTVISVVTILNRRSVLLNSLSLAAFVMLLWNPLNLYDIGFEMSFMAVLGIALVMPLLQPKKSPHGLPMRIAYWIWGVIAVSIAAQIGTAPLVAYYFGRFSCYFILTNLIVIPCATIILYGAVAAAAFSWLPVLSGVVASLVIAVSGFMNSSMHWIASLPGASLENIHWTVWQVLAVYIFLLAVYLLALFAKRK